MAGHSRPVTDFPQNEQGLVDQFIGTAYDVVLGVYNALPLLQTLGPQLEQVAAAAASITQSVSQAAGYAQAAGASLAAIGNSVNDAASHAAAAEASKNQAGTAVTNALAALQAFQSNAAASATSANNSANNANLYRQQAQLARDEAVAIAGFDVTNYVTKIQARRIATTAALIFGE